MACKFAPSNFPLRTRSSVRTIDRFISQLRAAVSDGGPKLGKKSGSLYQLGIVGRGQLNTAGESSDRACSQNRQEQTLTQWWTSVADDGQHWTISGVYVCFSWEPTHPHGSAPTNVSDVNTALGQILFYRYLYPQITKASHLESLLDEY